MSDETFNEKGPPCEICKAICRVKWNEQGVEFEPGWVLRIGPAGIGVYCPEHSHHGKPLSALPCLCADCARKVGKA